MSENFNFIIPLKTRISNAKADAAYDAGLTDPDWVAKGPSHFLEFNRTGDSFEEVAAKAFFECESHGIKPHCVNRFTPSGFLEKAIKPTREADGTISWKAVEGIYD